MVYACFIQNGASLPKMNALQLMKALMKVLQLMKALMKALQLKKALMKALMKAPMKALMKHACQTATLIFFINFKKNRL